MAAGEHGARLPWRGATPGMACARTSFARRTPVGLPSPDLGPTHQLTLFWLYHIIFLWSPTLTYAGRPWIFFSCHRSYEPRNSWRTPCGVLPRRTTVCAAFAFCFFSSARASEPGMQRSIGADSQPAFSLAHTFHVAATASGAAAPFVGSSTEMRPAPRHARRRPTNHEVDCLWNQRNFVLVRLGAPFALVRASAAVDAVGLPLVGAEPLLAKPARRRAEQVNLVLAGDRRRRDEE